MAEKKVRKKRRKRRTPEEIARDAATSPKPVKARRKKTVKRASIRKKPVDLDAEHDLAVRLRIKQTIMDSILSHGKAASALIHALESTDMAQPDTLGSLASADAHGANAHSQSTRALEAAQALQRATLFGGNA